MKVIVIGDSNVGKSCLLYRLAEGKFNNDLFATIGVDFYSKIINVEQVKVKLQLWDTAGQE